MSSRSASVFTASRNLSDTCPQHHWRWNRLAQLVAHEHRQLGSGCQPAVIAVEVETVEALHFQRDVPIKEFRDGCHSRILRQSWADRKSTRLNSSHRCISYAVFCLKKK